MNEVITDAAGHVYVDTESNPGQITMEIGHGDYAGPSWMEPAHARALAAVLLRAADEAESGVSEEARLRLELAAVDDELRKAGIEYPLGARGVRDLANMLDAARNRE
ncbi:hypothetical protein AQJ23_45205 [Streptomyces antibioticus]|nr:hypothetical protein [Streptomyces antibioticus]KUN16477.1 hypothetical protein AQJ23_45205 [Streptomyces antibioticus]